MIHYIVHNRHSSKTQRHDHTKKPGAYKLNYRRVLSMHPAQRSECALEAMQQVKRYSAHRQHIKYHVPQLAEAFLNPGMQIFYTHYFKIILC